VELDLGFRLLENPIVKPNFFTSGINDRPSVFETWEKKGMLKFFSFLSFTIKEVVLLTGRKARRMRGTYHGRIQRSRVA